MARKKRPSLREEQKMLTRERLLDAAFEVFTEVGYASATIDNIVNNAGVYRTTFYMYFKNKLDVAVALGQREAKTISRFYIQLAQLENPTLQDVRAWLDTRVAHCKGTVQMMQQVMCEAINSESQFAIDYAEYLEQVVDSCVAKMRLPGAMEQQSLFKAKFILLIVLIDRVILHRQCQQVDLAGDLALDALAEMIWQTLFCPMGLFR